MSMSKTFQNSVLAYFLLFGDCWDTRDRPAPRFSESSGSLTILLFWPRLLFWQHFSLFLKILFLQIQQDVELDLTEQLMERKGPLTQTNVTGEGTVMSGKASGR